MAAMGRQQPLCLQCGGDAGGRDGAAAERLGPLWLNLSLSAGFANAAAADIVELARGAAIAECRMLEVLLIFPDRADSATVERDIKNKSGSKQKGERPVNTL